MSKTHIPELPCEKDVRLVFGSQWRTIPEQDRDGAWGVAIVSSIASGVAPDLNALAFHLGVDRDMLRMAYRRLSMNGGFQHNIIKADRDALKSGDMLAWCFYAGYASGDAGLWRDTK